MVTYRPQGSSERISGATARDVIKALRAASRDPQPSLAQFMRTVATRAYRQAGVRVPTDSQARFVAALVRAGLLIEEKQE